MVTEKSERLRLARKKAGFETAAAAAERFEWPVGAYRHHENGTRGFGPDAARKYGRAFKVKPGWLLGWDGVDEKLTDLPTDNRLVVNGAVEAGVWRQSEEWNDERAFVIEDRPTPVPGAKRFGLVVEGRSMDVVYEPGTVLDCISIFSQDIKPETGDHVIVEHVRPDGLRELTVKEYLAEDGHYFLLPRSTKPEFQERIEIGHPSHDHNGDDRIEVIGFVVGSIPPSALKILKRMGLVKPLM